MYARCFELPYCPRSWQRVGSRYSLLGQIELSYDTALGLVVLEILRAARNDPYLKVDRIFGVGLGRLEKSYQRF